MQHFEALSDHDLETITGGAEDSPQQGSGGSWLSNQWKSFKDGWSNIKDNAVGDLKRMMGPAGRYSGL